MYHIPGFRCDTYYLTELFGPHRLRTNRQLCMQHSQDFDYAPILPQVLSSLAFLALTVRIGGNAAINGWDAGSLVQALPDLAVLAGVRLEITVKK